MTQGLFTSVGASAATLVDQALFAFLPLKSAIQTHFGSNGLIAFYLAAAVVACLTVYKLVQLAYASVKYVVIPSVVLAFLVSMVLPYSFAMVLPFTVAACSLVLLFKG